MAKGKVHERVNLLLLLPSLFIFGKIDLLFFSLGYLLDTFFFSPDMDIKTSKSMQRWGKLKFIWLPYIKIFKHRKSSHWPLIGGVVRIIYLFIVCFFFYYVMLFLYLLFLSPTGEVKVSAFYINYQSPKLWAFILGMGVSEFYHLILDIIASLFN